MNVGARETTTRTSGLFFRCICGRYTGKVKADLILLTEIVFWQSFFIIIIAIV